jgi:hypothetical protein
MANFQTLLQKYSKLGSDFKIRIFPPRFIAPACDIKSDELKSEVRDFLNDYIKNQFQTMAKNVVKHRHYCRFNWPPFLNSLS